MLYGSANPLNVFLILSNYGITRKSNMAAKMAAIRSVTRIRFIIILERYCWCLFHGTVLLIMALLKGKAKGGMGNTLVGFQSNDALFLCCCTLRQHIIYEVRSWSRGNIWYYAERACSLPLSIEPP